MRKRLSRREPWASAPHDDADVRISVERDVARGLTVVVPRGELTWANATTMRTGLFTVISERPPAIVVDLTGLTARSPALLSVFACAYHAACRPPVVVLALVAAGELTHALARRGQCRGQLVYARLPAAVDAVRAGTATAGRIQLHLRPTPDAPHVARATVEDACLSWGLTALVQDAQLVVSELVTNAVDHAGTHLDVTVDLRGPYLHLAVRDHDPARRPTPDPTEALLGRSARCLRIVAATATGWGSVHSSPGNTVWAILRTRPIVDGWA